MKQLTTVIVSGGYGAGKTRLVGQLAEAAGPEDGIIALVHQTGPVNLDPLWLPGQAVVTMQDSCGCSGGSELVECLLLLQQREHDLVLVELAGDQEPGPLAKAAAGLEGVEVIVVPVADVEEGADLQALRTQFGIVDGDHDHAHEHAHEHEHGEGCGCGQHGDDGHAHGGCTCAERRFSPQWMPFWFAEDVAEERLVATLEQLPEAVIRVKGVLHLDEDRWLQLDRAAGKVTRRVLTADTLPELFDYDTLLEGESMDPTPPDGGALLVWADAADEEAAVALEWEVARALADCFGVEEEPDAAAAFALESLGEEELIFEALTAARMAAVLVPEAPEYAELLAKCYHELQENEHAMWMLREAARRDPTHLSSRLNSARLHLAYEESDAACALAEVVVGEYPEDPDARAVLGEALLTLGKLERAAEHLEVAALQMTEDDVLRSMLCNLFAELGDYQKALAYNSEVLSLDPDDDGAMYLRGELLLRLDRAEDAVQALDQALAAGNESPWVMTALGIAHHRCENAEEAAGCFADAFVLSQEQLAHLPDDSSSVDLLLAAAFRGRLDQVTELWEGLDTLDIAELAKARDTLSLAPERGEAQKTLEAIDKILVAKDG